MSSKITSATQSWSNVNQAIESFKTDDKTLVKIIKFIPNIIILIVAIFIDVSNKVLHFLKVRSKAFSMESKQGTAQDAPKNDVIERAKDIWKNHKKMVLLFLGGIGIGIFALGRNLPMLTYKDFSFKSRKKTITLSNLIVGGSSEFMSYTPSLVPGVALLLTAAAIGAMGADKYEKRTLSGKALIVTSVLGAAALGAFNVGFFLLQANCIGWEINQCAKESFCHEIIKNHDGRIVARGGKPPYWIDIEECRL